RAIWRVIVSSLLHCSVMVLFNVSMASSWNVRRASRASMRSPSVFASLIRILCDWALPQPMSERDALVENKTVAAPAARSFRYLFEILQDAAFEVVDLGKAARQQKAGGFLATNAAGAEHCDLAVLRRVEMTRRKILELSERPDAWVDSAGKGTHRD